MKTFIELYEEISLSEAKGFKDLKRKFSKKMAQREKQKLIDVTNGILSDTYYYITILKAVQMFVLNPNNNMNPKDYPTEFDKQALKRWAETTDAESIAKDLQISKLKALSLEKAIKNLENIKVGK